MTTSAAFWDKAAEKYAKKPVGNIAFMVATKPR
jgi:hypothetical protein